jgi:hypothetical protein
MKTFKEFLNEGINDKGIFKAVFVIGIPGSGKSYTVSTLSGGVGPRIVNTDKATEYLAAKSGGAVDPTTWAKEYRDTALRITKNSLSAYLNGMLPLFVDGTSNDASNLLHRMGILESLGYDVGIVYVNTSLEDALARVEKRNATTKRQVDLDFVKKVHERTEANVEFLRGKVSFFVDVKNSGDEYTDEVMMKAFKKAQTFFSSAISNPIGARHIEKLKASGGKYLTPDIMSMDTLKNKVDGWYK